MAAVTNWSRVRSIGCRATAIVSLAVNTKSGQFFAVKSTDISRSPSLQREQSILSALHSPYIISYLGFDIATDESYNLFLEYAPSSSLCDVIRSHGGRIDEPTIRAYAADILHGLAYIHSNSVVYCYIKSSYVVGSNGRAEIADFGCAQRGFGSNKTQTIMGTPVFMAPEVARGEEQAEAYMVIEMATGCTPRSDAGGPMAALCRIGYSNDVPDIPVWLSNEGKDFLRKCFEERSQRKVDGGAAVDAFVCFVGVKKHLGLRRGGGGEKILQSYDSAKRFLQLAGSGSFGSNWMSDERWITVRSKEGMNRDDALFLGHSDHLIAPDGEVIEQHERQLINL